MASNTINISKVIFGVLSNDSALTNIIPASKIQPSAIYNISPTEGIYYDILNSNNENIKDVGVGPIAEITFQIEVFHKEYDQAIRAADRVSELLDKINPATYYTVKVNGCHLTNARTDFDGNNKYYYISLIFDCRLDT